MLNYGLIYGWKKNFTPKQKKELLLNYRSTIYDDRVKVNWLLKLKEN